MESSAPSSRLTTKETATRAPPGHRTRGGWPPWPLKSRSGTLVISAHLSLKSLYRSFRGRDVRGRAPALDGSLPDDGKRGLRLLAVQRLAPDAEEMVAEIPGGGSRGPEGFEPQAGLLAQPESIRPRG